MKKKPDIYPRKRKGFTDDGDIECEGCFRTKLALDVLRAENQKLKTQIKYLKRGRQVVRQGAHTPSSQIPFKEKSKGENVVKRGGAVAGHPGRGRSKIAPESADETIEIGAPKFCDGCRCELSLHSTRMRSVFDVHEMKVLKKVYEIERRCCPRCKRVQESKPPLFPRALYGNALMSQIAVMHYAQGIPIGRICDMLGKEINPGGVFTALHRLAAKWEPVLDTLIQQYRQAPVKHADETSWRIDGEPGWSWLFCSPAVSIFECQNSRAARVAQRILGSEPLPGVLVVDRFSAYNRMPCQLQYCFAHLLREVKKVEDEFPEAAEVVSFTGEFAHLLSEAMRLPSRSLTDKDYYRAAGKIAGEIKALALRPAKHAGIHSIQRIFTSQEARLFQWVLDRNVPAHNNRAERELRQTVIARKVSFGSQSHKGARTRSIWMSILGTARKRLGGSSLEVWLKNALDSLSLSSDLNPIKLLPPTPS
jgi:transposase